MPTSEDLNHALSWPDTLARLHDFSSRLLLAIHGIPERDLGHPEAEGRWSILNVIGHLTDHELVTATRLRFMLSSEHPQLFGYEQEQFVASRRDTLAQLLEQFGALRQMNLMSVERMPDDELARAADHLEYGVMTIRQLVNRLQRHAEKHLLQIERIKTTLGLRASDQPDVSGVVATHTSTAKVRNITPGIRVLDLWQNGVRKAMQVDIDPGAVWPGLDHHVPGPEEVFVASGDFNDGKRTYEAGSFIHHPAGSSHVPQSKTGCRLFVFYPEG